MAIGSQFVENISPEISNIQGEFNQTRDLHDDFPELVQRDNFRFYSGKNLIPE
jgi:hypothetical protein